MSSHSIKLTICLQVTKPKYPKGHLQLYDIEWDPGP